MMVLCYWKINIKKLSPFHQVKYPLKVSIIVDMQHFLSGLDLQSDCPQNYESIVFGLLFLGCGKEILVTGWCLVNLCRVFWWDSRKSLYQEVCSGTTDHVEVVKVIFNPDIMPVLECFAQSILGVS